MGNIASIKYIGEAQTYDLELDHKDHQFYLSNGVLTSNSHAVLYSMISYHTAYLKAHFPIEFLLANLMAEVKSPAPDAKGNIEKIKKELRSYRIKVVPPDINSAGLTYTITGNKLITGLEAIKYVKQDPIEDIISKRPFKDFFDFMARVDSKKVRANTIQALIAGGCFDSFGLSRKTMFLYCSDVRKKMQVWLKTHDINEDEFAYPFPEEKEWNFPELYALEWEYLNDTFICGKLEAYGAFFKGNDYVSIADVRRSQNKTPIRSMKAVIRDFHEFTVKKEASKFYGKSMAKVMIEDVKNDQIVMTVFPDRWEMIHERIQDIYKNKYKFDVGMALHFSGSVNVYNDEIGVILNDFYNAVPPPSKPSDMKSRKINLKIIKKNNKQKQSMAEELEDELLESGLLELDDDAENE